MSRARFSPVRFMFQYKGRVRVTLDRQSAESGGVDSLLEETLAAGAEDFDQIPGSGEDVEVEVRELFFNEPTLPFCFMYISV
jgi:transcriptional/translational regulatory protein YebC/TACO1